MVCSLFRLFLGRTGGVVWCVGPKFRACDICCEHMSLVCRLSSALISSDVLLQPYGGLFGTCSLSWDVFANLLCTEACLASVCSSLVRCFFCNPMEACLSPDRVSFGGFGIYGGSLVVCTLSCDGFGRPLEACFPSALSRALFFCKPTMEACLSCALSLFAFWAL